MTGHKSKGLEFPVVILPNLDFSLDSKKAKYLIEDKGYFLYAGLSVKSPIKSIANFTKQEKSQNFIDKLNLCYVMMTRPVERLYIGNLYQKGNFGATFHAAILGLEPSIWSGSSSEDKFIYGEKSLKSEAHTSAPIDNFIPTNFNDRLWFPDISLNASLLQEDADLNAARRYGNQLHEALSIINRVEEIPDTLEWMYKEGKIEIEFLNRITNELSVILNHPAYQSLLKDAIKISNEQAIIIGPKETKRPDKIIVKENETIVVDFKTGLATKNNEKQVSMYKKVLSEMHFKNVKGYLFYTGNLQLQEI
jgi:hypothetical protein